MRLKDKVAIITGASRGIGRAIALGFALEGAHVTLAARTQAELDAVAAEIHAQTGGHPRALVVPTDVTVEEQVKAMVDATVATFGRVDILVNNAGVGAFRPAYGTPLKTWEWIMSINATSTFLCTKHAWKPMQKAGGGSIINISSLSGTRIYPMYSAYSASKWAQLGFTKVTAEEGKPVNIRVNALAPGKVDTPMRANVSEDKDAMLKAEDCVPPAIFLASDEARWITGQILEIEWF
ncbi:MAG: SDR family oxidoreductase [Anaerolineales bacterium]|nr:SDR family oxidoreductase [Anaerolineales bacterium]